MARFVLGVLAMSKAAQRKISSASNRGIYEVQKRKAFNQGLLDAKKSLPMANDYYVLSKYCYYVEGYQSYKKNSPFKSTIKNLSIVLLIAVLVFSFLRMS